MPFEPRLFRDSGPSGRKLVRARFLALLLGMTLLVGCLTQKSLDEWEAMPLESARLDVVSAAGDRVVLGWETTYRGGRTQSGEVQLDPRLPNCEEVRVFLRDAKDIRLLPGDEAARGGVDPSALPGSCDVVIFITHSRRVVGLRASSADRVLGDTRIDAPRNHIWLAVVPLAAVADTVIVTVAVVGAIPVLAVIGALSSEQSTTWTWTP